MNNEGDWSFFNGLENIKNAISNVFEGISNLFAKKNETEKLPFVSGRRSKFLRCFMWLTCSCSWKVQLDNRGVRKLN